ncbi:MAG: hypothetical protein M1561_04135 [Gammaproteobacteria bacterium]|nr:hypothetical protein [Gammaproteobacteria bacterium]
MQKVIYSFFAAVFFIFSANVLAQPSAVKLHDFQALKDLVNQTATSVATIKIDYTNNLTAVSDRITTIEKVNTDTQTQLKAIASRLTAIQADLVQIKSEQKLEQQSFFYKFSAGIDELQKRFGKDVFTMVVIGVFVILLLLIVWLFYPQKENTREKMERSFAEEAPEIEADEAESALDTEGIAAKLNLAHAYIDMGKNDDARALLQEVIIHGDDAQIAEAQALQEKIQ